MTQEGSLFILILDLYEHNSGWHKLIFLVTRTINQSGLGWLKIDKGRNKVDWFN